LDCAEEIKFCLLVDITQFLKIIFSWWRYHEWRHWQNCTWVGIITSQLRKTRSFIQIFWRVLMR